MALLGHVTIRRPGEPEAYAQTADLYERFTPGNPNWRVPRHCLSMLRTGQRAD